MAYISITYKENMKTSTQLYFLYMIGASLSALYMLIDNTIVEILLLICMIINSIYFLSKVTPLDKEEE